jgi:CDP-diacylglycerol--serine O-phosphatidyltransferase
LLTEPASLARAHAVNGRVDERPGRVVVDSRAVNLRKTFFILPNLFTLSSVFCGFFAIATIARGAAGIGDFYQAAIAICFGFFFDMADGRVARLTKTQSSLGLELDSLADVITFGVAPALLMYRWGFDRIEPRLGMVVCFIYVAAGALRLARFNVLAHKEADEKKKPGKYILGLPVPASSAMLVSFVVLSYQVRGEHVDISQAALACVVVVLSYLMVSRVRFRSFKDLKPSRRTFTVGGGLAAAAVVAIFFKRVPSALVFVCLMGAYVGLGLFEEVLFYRRRRLEERASRAGASAMPALADGGAHSDEEVLEELGAFDAEEGEPQDLPADGPPLAKVSRR